MKEKTFGSVSATNVLLFLILSVLIVVNCCILLYSSVHGYKWLFEDSPQKESYELSLLGSPPSNPQQRDDATSYKIPEKEYSISMVMGRQGNANDTLKEDGEDDEDPTQQEEEASIGFLVLFITLIIIIFLTWVFLKLELKYLPESIITIFVGVFLGAILRIYGKSNFDVFKLETRTFFLILLPPIIFESGYNLHKGNFFGNFLSISVFAVLGTIISSFVVGIGLGIFGLLPWIDCMIFGSLISSVDPVATLAIFSAMDVDPTLYTLVFGESVLNDAISIVLFRTFIGFLHEPFSMEILLQAFSHFILTFFGSISIGCILALFTALIFKHISFGRHSSLEVSLMFIMAYIPYLIAEGLQLSGILSILTNAIVNSYYTHYNLSPHTQITVQQTFHMLSFLCEAIVFVYLGLAVFTFHHQVNIVLILMSIVLVLLGRALNIFPLSSLVNKFRRVKISNVNQLIIWFSGLRGAVCFALALGIPDGNRGVIVTTTLVVVMFSMVLLGGSTYPLMKFLSGSPSKRVIISKTDSFGTPVSSGDAEEQEKRSRDYSIFGYFDDKYLRPYFRSSKPTILPEDLNIEELQISQNNEVSNTCHTLEVTSSNEEAISNIEKTSDSADDDEDEQGNLIPK